jgi:hypothetical protein
MIIRSVLILADVELPGVQGINAPPPATHVQPALVGLAVLALAIVGFLIYDLFRQKHNERQERAKLERFREKRLRQ